MGRFGYRVSKEKFLFLSLGIPSMSNPGGSGVFRCAGRRALRLEGAAFQRISRDTKRSVALHKEAQPD
jgi:hypothetical protein